MIPPPAAPADCLVTIVAAVYESQATLEGFLAHLAAQTRRDFAVILVDSSPGLECSSIAERWKGRLPTLDYRHAARRMFPQEARNAGAAAAATPLLVFTDPDVYAEPGWLHHLVARHEAAGGPVVGALACHPGGWLDQGFHLCKFSKWLPAGASRPVDMAPTANLLVPRDLFTAIGGFAGDMLMSDTTLSWEMRRRGWSLMFEPNAVVAHDHVQGIGSFLRERVGRGRRFGELRLGWEGGGRSRAGLWLAATPLRLLTNLWWTARHAAAARQLDRWLATLPVIVAGFVASLAGEALGYAAKLGASAGGATRG